MDAKGLLSSSQGKEPICRIPEIAECQRPDKLISDNEAGGLLNRWICWLIVLACYLCRCVASLTAGINSMIMISTSVKAVTIHANITNMC